MTETAELTPEAPAETPAAEASTEKTKVQKEREAHGPESACQLIGHLGVPRKGVEHAVYQEPRKRDDDSETLGMVWGTIAVNNGEGFDPSWLFYNIFPVVGENGERPSREQMEELAQSLSKGKRVRLQGPLQIRQGAGHTVTIDGEEVTIRDTSATVKLFWDGTAVPYDEKGARPITFLPRIGSDEGNTPDLGF